MNERRQRLTMLIDEAYRDLMPPGTGPLTPAEREAFGERLAASIRTMPDVHSVEFVSATGTLRFIRTPEPVVRIPITITVGDEEVMP